MLEVTRIGSSAVHDAFLSAAGLSRLPPPDAAALGLDRLVRLSLQFPGEHCTECAAPDCHTTCDLFERGATGRCKRFEDGIVARPGGAGPFAHSLEILFRPSAQLIAVGNAWAMPRVGFRLCDAAIPLLGRLSMRLQGAFRWLPPRAQWKVTDKIRGAGNRLPRLLNRLARRDAASGALIAILGNPQREAVHVELGVSGFGASQGGRRFQRVVEIPHGWHAVSIPAGEIAAAIDLGKLFRITLVPLIEANTLLQILYFGFAQRTEDRGQRTEDRAGQTEAKKVKLVVLDLDNTLWDGILIENPEAPPALFPGVRETLETLDARGILLSLASKNNEEETRRALQRLGLWDLFLYPQIDWTPKSVGLRRTVERLNIGMDTVAFVDDSAFERAEVKDALPEVRVWEAAELTRLPALAEFDVPATEESRGRRQMYREEQDRHIAFANSSLDYDAFLARCDIRLVLGPLNVDNMDRVYELVQRTNQLNFSGNRYTRDDLARLQSGGNVLPVVMRCEDRFGRYGIVGFSLLRVAPPALEMIDVMFSCRIQGKKVEHAYLGHLAGEAGRAGLARLVCLYRRTARNAAAAKVFDDLGFARETADKRERYSLACAVALPPLPVRVMDEAGLRGRLAALPRLPLPAAEPPEAP